MFQQKSSPIKHQKIDLGVKVPDQRKEGSTRKRTIGGDGTRTSNGNNTRKRSEEPPNDDHHKEGSTRKGTIGGDDTRMIGGDDTRIRSGKPEQSHRRRGRRTHHLRSGCKA